MPCSMKGPVKNKLQPWRLAKDCFLDSLPLLRRGVATSCSVPQLLSLSRGCGSFGLWLTSASDSCPLMVLPETLSLRRFASLANWVALANQGSIGDFAPIAISGHARGHTVRQGPWPARALGTTRVLILSLDLLHFRFQRLQPASYR